MWHHTDKCRWAICLLKMAFKTFNEQKNITVEIHNILFWVMYILFKINIITFNNKYCMELANIKNAHAA